MALNAVAAGVSVTMDAPGKVRVGETFYVVITIKNSEGNISGPDRKEINGCKFLYGPSTTSSQSYTIINGQQSSSSSVTKTFTYRAEKEGSYQIGGYTVMVDGKRYNTPSKTLQIVAANNAPASQRPVAIDDIDTKSVDRNVSGKDVFVRIITSKSAAYVGEAIECTIKLYTKYSITEFMPVTQPSFDGFLVEELQFQPMLNKIENINGQDYATAVVKKVILFPQKGGKLTINSGTYDLGVEVYETVDMGFYNVKVPHAKKLRVNTNNSTVDVKALPQPQPAGFNGAVGQFNVSAKMSSNSYRTNEPTTLTYTITGSGNIKYIKDPQIDVPSEFEQYSPQHTTDAEVVGNTFKGSTVFEQTFVPRETGDYTLSIPEFIYFNPESGQYVTLKGYSFKMNVAKGVSGGSDRKDVASKNIDILYIKTGKKSPSHTHPYYIASPGYWSLMLLLVLLLIGVWGYTRIAKRRTADVAGMKFSKANKVARRRLSQAGKYMKADDTEHFYEETLRALWGYLSDKLGIPASQLTRSNIEQQLTDRGATPEAISQLITVLDTCEMARYTPSAPGHMETVYNDATSVINHLERTKLIK